MVLLGFTIPKLEQLILDGIKRCTIRKPAKKYPNGKPRYYTGAMLNLYMYPRQPKMHKLFDAPCISVLPLRFPTDFNMGIALADGFTDLKECLKWFKTTHATYINSFIASEEFPIFHWIYWDYDNRIMPANQKTIFSFIK